LCGLDELERHRDAGSSSLCRDNPRGDSTTVPSTTLVARSRNDAALLADKPTARRDWSDRTGSAAGCTSLSRALINRR
jgi:hypothetical protein